MAAFEKVKSGIPSLDEIVDFIRLGDNVVFQISSIDEFCYFVEPFVKQAVEDKRNLIYIRFAKHKRLVEEGVAKEFCLNPEDGFDMFTSRVHRIIEEEGKDAFYVFDCLSELQVAWAADLMMGNFFRVTCPFLFTLDTVAFFPILRGCHSFSAVARIRETTQLFLDVYSEENSIYIHPIKVWNRYSAAMFLPHRSAADKKEFSVLSDAVSVSKFYSVIASAAVYINQAIDSWDRYFEETRLRGDDIDEESLSNLCRMMLTKDEKLRVLFKKYFTKEDYFRVKKAMIGTGHIGGKSCGMLIARKIVEAEAPQLAGRTEPHDSFYVGDHIFYSYLVDNDLWDLWMKQKTPEGYITMAPRLREGIMNGVFSESIRDEFRRMLEHFGQAPIIARSSSLLEDGFGNAFAGKYESVFCPNGGSEEERLSSLEQAIKRIYASTMNPSALEYRLIRGLDNKDEQMAILVQRVSGSMFGQYFMPTAAGVGYSFNTFCWDSKIDSSKGMLRLVAGLGTRAVDRTDSDYPRIIAVDKPLSSTLTTIEEKVRFSQHKLDVIDTKENRLREISLDDILPYLKGKYERLLVEHDYQTELRLAEMGRRMNICFATCQGVAEDKQFVEDMKTIMHTIQNAYEYPVDIEFTVNYSPEGEYVICLLQCRPLQVAGKGKKIEIPEFKEENIIFKNVNSSMGMPQKRKLDVFVLVNPKAYHEYPYNQKTRVANAIGEINRLYKESGKSMILLTPGRLGTSSPELGVPASFSDISCFNVIAEVADSENCYSPELSYGSHMFQDFVEAEMFYTAVSNNGESFYNADKIKNGLKKMPLPERYEALSDIVELYEADERDVFLYYDIESKMTVCGFE